MGEDENPLARWSRLKREHAGAKGEDTAAASPGDASSVPQPPAKAGDEASAAFDDSRLPPIESIVAGSDVRVFLQKGVPAALTRAALRKAWSTDPAIRDFIEMAENQWDFASAEGIPGFGSLTIDDRVPELVAKAVGAWHKDGEPATALAAADNPTANPPHTHPAPPSSSQADQCCGGRETSCAEAAQPSTGLCD